LIATGRGMTTIARGAQQAFNVVTGDEAAFEETKQRGQRETAAFKPLEESQPLATFIGEVIGESAAFPVGGVGTGLVRRGVTSAVSGVVAGAATEAGQGGEDVGVMAVAGGVFGPIGEGIGTLVQRFGGPAVQAVKDLIQNKVGSVPPGLITDQGVITEQGEKLLGSLNITRQEFRQAFASLTDANKLDNLDPEAQLRVGRAQAEGVSLTQGQATREFELQSGEDILKGLEGREGERARLFFNDQQKQLIEAKDKFLSSIGDDLELSRTQRGSDVRASVRDLDNLERISISNLYDELARLPGGTTKIKTDVYKQFADETVREFVPTSRIQKGIRIIFNDFEIGEGAKKSVTSQGPLTFKNAEKLRKRLNKLSPTESADIKTVQALKSSFDDLVAGATAQFPENTP